MLADGFGPAALGVRRFAQLVGAVGGGHGCYICQVC
jgi:hypothetical protein